MLKRFIAVFLMLVVLGGCARQQAPSSPVGLDKPHELLIAASFYTVADFSAKIAGDRARIVNLVPAGGEPHDWEPSIRDMETLEKADVLILNGAGFEHWPDSIIPTLQNKSLMVVDTSVGLTLKEGDGNGHHTHQHDPHVWLDPSNARSQMEQICEALVKADPEGEAVYRENYKKYAAKCEALDKKYQETLEPLPRKEIVVSHKAFSYLCDRYGLDQVSVQGTSPEGEPDPAHLAEVIDYAREHQVTVIFHEYGASDKVADVVAREIGAVTAALNPLENLSEEQAADGGDYFSVMEENLEQLKAALS